MDYGVPVVLTLAISDVNVSDASSCRNLLDVRSITSGSVLGGAATSVAVKSRANIGEVLTVNCNKLGVDMDDNYGVNYGLTVMRNELRYFVVLHWSDLPNSMAEVN